MIILLVKNFFVQQLFHLSSFISSIASPIYTGIFEPTNVPVKRLQALSIKEGLDILLGHSSSEA